MRDPFGSNMTEADVTINGVPLTFGQSMALRVAANNFAMELQDPDALGDDEGGRSITKGYRERLAEVLGLMTRDKQK